MSDTFNLNAGSDFETFFAWPDPQGGDADLTGYSVEVYRAEGLPTGVALTAALSDAPAGVVRISMPWDDAIKEGDTIGFRVRIVSQSGHRTSTNKMKISVQ